MTKKYKNRLLYRESVYFDNNGENECYQYAPSG